MKKSIPYLLLVIVLITSIVVLYLRANTLEHPLVWHGIEPGKTKVMDVKRLLGEPTNIIETSGSMVYIYENLANIGWEKVEVSISQSDLIAQEILLLYPVDDAWKSFNLDILIDNYGKPNFISWTAAGYFRFIAWTKRGLAVECSVYHLLDKEEKPELYELKINGVFIFHPMTQSEFKQKRWELPSFFGWSEENYSSPKYTDAPDVLPKNPFGWIILP